MFKVLLVQILRKQTSLVLLLAVMFLNVCVIHVLFKKEKSGLEGTNPKSICKNDLLQR